MKNLNLEFNFAGKSVLVTGSSRGIGREIGKSFLDNGAEVIFNGTKLNSLNKVTEELEIPKKYGVKADVTDFSEAKQLILKAENIMKKIDVIVCNVGSGKSVKPGNEDYLEWQKVFKNNLWSTTNIVEAGKFALKRTEGIFICISSICGHEIIDGAPITYSTAKNALNFYIKSIARPLSKDGIRINGISPGNILFEDSTWDQKIKQNPSIIREVLKNVPLSRFGEPKDISSMCLWLASEYADFCTGSIFIIDGGQLRT